MLLDNCRGEIQITLFDHADTSQLKYIYIFAFYAEQAKYYNIIVIMCNCVSSWQDKHVIWNIVPMQLGIMYQPMSAVRML